MVFKINHITFMILDNMYKNVLKDTENVELYNFLYVQKTKNVQYLNWDIKMKTHKQIMSI